MEDAPTCGLLLLALSRVFRSICDRATRNRTDCDTTGRTTVGRSSSAVGSNRWLLEKEPQPTSYTTAAAIGIRRPAFVIRP